MAPWRGRRQVTPLGYTVTGDTRQRQSSLVLTRNGEIGGSRLPCGVASFYNVIFIHFTIERHARPF